MELKNRLLQYAKEQRIEQEHKRQKEEREKLAQQNLYLKGAQIIYDDCNIEHICKNHLRDNPGLKVITATPGVELEYKDNLYYPAYWTIHGDGEFRIHISKSSVPTTLSALKQVFSTHGIGAIELVSPHTYQNFRTTYHLQFSINLLD